MTRIAATGIHAKACNRFLMFFICSLFFLSTKAQTTVAVAAARDVAATNIGTVALASTGDKYGYDAPGLRITRTLAASTLQTTFLGSVTGATGFTLSADESILYYATSDGFINKLILGTATTTRINATAITNGSDIIDMALDENGNLFFARRGNNTTVCGVYRINTTTGVISNVIIGQRTGTSTSVGDGSVYTTATNTGNASVFKAGDISGLAYDKTNKFIYVADRTSLRVRKIDISSTTGLISTYVGNGTAGNGNGVPAVGPTVSNGIYGLSLDGVGNLYILDKGVTPGSTSGLIKRVAFTSNGTGNITTIAGGGITTSTPTTPATNFGFNGNNILDVFVPQNGGSYLISNGNGGTSMFRVTDNTVLPPPPPPVGNISPVIVMQQSDLILNTGNASSIIIDNSLTVSDADNANLARATVQVTEGGKTDEDEFTFSPFAGITSSFNASAVGGPMLTLTGISSLANYQTILRSVQYVNAKGTNGTAGAKRIAITVDDGLATGTASRRLIILIANSPLLDNLENTSLSYTEGSGAVSISNTIALTSSYSTTMSSGSVQLTGNYVTGEDFLSFTNQNGITGSWSAATGKLTLSGTATNADYQAALRSVKYTNSSVNPGTSVRTATFIVTDGLYESNPATRNISILPVNNAPVLAAIEATGFTHTENTARANITSTITVSDVDNTSLINATIAITSNYRNSQDVLSFTNQNGIAGTWNPATGTLSLSGVSTLANYQAALRSVQYYQTTNYNFNGNTRTVSITVNDGALSSNTLTRNITPVTKAIVNFNYAEALQKSLYFYEGQRSGSLPAVRGKNPGQNRVEWRGNSLMNDGKDVGKDLTGGWHDAGDTYKCNNTMAYAASFLAWSGVEYNGVYSSTNQQPYLLDNLKHINDYFIRCFVDDQPGTYEFYSQVTDDTYAHGQWAAPEVLDLIFPAIGSNKSYRIDVTCKGSDVAGHTSAALAASSIVFRNAGGAANVAYADLLLSKARKLFDFGDTYRGVDGHRNSAGVISKTENYFYRDNNYWDEMMWGAIWLHKAEQAALTAGYTNAYLTKANEYYNLTPNPDNAYAHFRELFFSNVAPAAFTLLTRETTGATQVTYKRRVERWLDWWTIGYFDKVKYSAGGMAAKTSSSSISYAPLRYSTNQAFVAGIYSDDMVNGAGVDGSTAPVASPAINTTIDRKAIYDKFAQTQIRYALGDNPYTRSYVIGFGPNPWNASHHRGAHGPWAGFEHLQSNKPQYNVTNPRHTFYGALLGGPTKVDGNANPLDEFDLSVNNVNNSVTNEVTLDFNAGLPGAFARMMLKNPGTGNVLANFPAEETRDDEFFVEARTNSISATSINVKAQINNRSAWPARSSNKLSTKYFFTLDAGVAVGALTVTTGAAIVNTNSEGQVISPITNFSGNIYYVEVSFPGKVIFPGGVIPATNTGNNVHWFREANFTITGPAGWNNNNDWSYNGISALNNTLTKTRQMPVYDDGVLIFGIEPGDNVAPTLTNVSIRSNNATPSLAKVGDVVTLTFMASEGITVPTVKIAGNGATLSVSGNIYTANYTMTSADANGPVSISINGFADFAGNAGAEVTATTDLTSVTFDKEAPNVITQNISVPLNNSNLATITAQDINFGSTDNVGIASLSINLSMFSCQNLGPNTVTLTVTDEAGNVSSAQAIVTVEDNTAPIVPVLSDVTGECSATASIPTTTDNCAGIITGATTDATTYNTQGSHLITWHFDDGHGNVSTAIQRVVIQDVTPPGAAVIPVVTSECAVTVIAPTTTDNCTGTITAVTADPVVYTLQGNYTINWVFDDGNGNTTTATQSVIIKDVTPPVVPILSDITSECAATASIPTTTDNCADIIAGTTNDPLTFTTQGTHIITWNFDDGNGNVSTATQKVIIKDVTAPVVPTLADVTGECAATASIPTTTDNCAGIIAGTTNDPLTYTTKGTHIITWSFSDGNGNVSTATQKVIIKDVTAPVVPTLADVTGECAATASIPTTTDNCKGIITGTTNDALTYTTQGTHIITWSFSDGNGNVSTATQKVIIKDVTAPVVPTLADVTGDCSATAATPTTTDNCTGIITGTTNDALNYTTQGTHIITWSFNDGNGNVSTATQKVVVKDATPPTVITKNITVVLVNGQVILTAAQVNNGSFDNCGIASISVSPNTFTCGQIGTNTVTLIVTDVNGLISSKTGTVTVEGVAPVVSINVSRTDNTFTGLDANTIAIGFGAQALTLTASNSSSSASASTYQWTPTTSLSSSNIANPVFTPTTAGVYTFTVTVTNEFGCITSKAVTITVMDVRCGNKNEGVIVCHFPNSNSNPVNQLCINKNAVDAHLKQGAKLGACNAVNTRNITTNFKSGVKNEVDLFTLKATPNPTTNYFSITIKGNRKLGLVYFNITDVSGRVLETRSGLAVGETITIGENYRPGTYILQASQGNQKQQMKLLKIRH